MNPSLVCHHKSIQYFIFSSLHFRHQNAFNPQTLNMQKTYKKLNFPFLAKSEMFDSFIILIINWQLTSHNQSVVLFTSKEDYQLHLHPKCRWHTYVRTPSRPSPTPNVYVPKYQSTKFTVQWSKVAPNTTYIPFAFFAF